MILEQRFLHFYRILKNLAFVVLKKLRLARKNNTVNEHLLILSGFKILQIIVHSIVTLYRQTTGILFI